MIEFEPEEIFNPAKRAGINNHFTYGIKIEERTVGTTGDNIHFGLRKFVIGGDLNYENVYPADAVISIEKSFRGGIFAPPGVGKSLSLQSIVDRAQLFDYGIIIVTDVKGEWASSREKVQEKYRGQLKPGESAQKFEVAEYYPQFLAYQGGKEPPPNAKIVQLGLKNISYEDLLALMDLPSKISPSKTNLLQNCFDSVKKSLEPTLEALIMEVGEYDFNPSTKETILNSLRRVQKIGIIGDDYDWIDIGKDIKEGNRIIFNIRGYEGIDKKTTQIYVGILTKQIVFSKDQGLIKASKKMLVVYEESGDFCPRYGKIYSKDEIEECVRKSRAQGISLMFVAQSPEMISEQIIGQMDIVFFSYKTNLSDMARLIKEKICPDFAGSSLAVQARLSEILRETKAGIHEDGSRDWFYFNGFRKEIGKNYFWIIKFYMCLSAHTEEKGAK